MIKLLAISCAEMKAMDTYAIENIGIPSIVLMETAALKVIEEIRLNSIHSYTIVCAPGNNGGDGLAIARHLVLKNKKVDLFIIGDLNKATKDFQINRTILKNMNVTFTHLTNENQLDKLVNATKENELTIDAIFGIGLDRDVEGLFYEVINIMNKYSKEILAVDLPSGLDGDTGNVLGIAIKADQTISFHQMKKGLVNQEEYIGNVVVKDIGIPQSVTQKILSEK